MTDPQREIDGQTLATRNVGGADAGLRCVAGAALLVVALMSTALPAFSLLCLGSGMTLLATGMTRRCPFYRWLGGRTESY